MTKQTLSRLLLLWIWLIAAVAPFSQAEDGYDMWLRYVPVTDNTLRKAYQQQLTQIVAEGDSPTMLAVAAELKTGLSGLLGKPINVTRKMSAAPAVVVGSTHNHCRCC